jgi:hypothetical protein
MSRKDVPIPVKRNSAEFKSIREFVNDHPDGHAIKLYSLKPYEQLKDRVLLKRKSSDDKVIYELELDQLRFNLLDPKRKLFRDDGTGIYFFKESAKSKFIEVPFELKGLK